MRIGFRTVKTAIGTGLAIALAEWMGLQFYASAGIITILCIKTTKKKSYQSAWERILACVVAIILSAILFQTLGYYPWAVGILLLIHIPVTLFLRAKEGIITSTVIMLHLYTVKDVNREIILNELALILIGVGFALLINLYMPNVEKQLKEYRQQIEDNFRRILHEIAIYLREGESDWDGREITETARLLKEAKSLALRDIENHAHDEEYNFYRYFSMRERQFEVLERMLPIVTSLHQTYIQGHKIADFIDRVADAIHPGVTAHIYLDELESMRKEFKQSPLPKDRLEFETRAALIHFVSEMKRYLMMKSDLMKQKSELTEREGNSLLSGLFHSIRQKSRKKVE